MCAPCLSQPPPFDETFAPLIYAPPVDSLLTGLKFRARLDAGRLLAALFAQAYARIETPGPDRLLPMPLHHSRLRHRGFNQALELARPVAAQQQLKLDIRAARRVRRTRQQSQLDARQRHVNLRGAFQTGDRVRGRDVAILDDIITTGDTAAELTRTLKRTGATRVRVWAVARAAQNFR
jgi:ComF family protein